MGLTFYYSFRPYIAGLCPSAQLFYLLKLNLSITKTCIKLNMIILESGFNWSLAPLFKVHFNMKLWDRRAKTSFFINNRMSKIYKTTVMVLKTFYAHLH